jgi:hypothetical protein
MHDLRTTPEMQRGRRLVYAIGRGGEIPAAGSDEYEAVNRVLAAHNNLAMYVRRGVINKSWVLDAWHHTLRDLRPGAVAFIDHRRETQSWRVWTDLERLMGDAERFRTKRPCCKDGHGLTGMDPSSRRRPAPVVDETADRSVPPGKKQ